MRKEAAENKLELTFDAVFFESVRGAVQVNFFTGIEKDKQPIEKQKEIYKAFLYLKKVEEQLMRSQDDKPWNGVSAILQEIQSEETNNDFLAYQKNFEKKRAHAIQMHMFRDIQKQMTHGTDGEANDAAIIEYIWRRRMGSLEQSGFEFFKFALVNPDFKPWVKRAFLSDDILHRYNAVEKEAYEANEIHIINARLETQQDKDKFLYHVIATNASSPVFVGTSGELKNKNEALVDYYASLPSKRREAFKEKMISFAAFNADRVEWVRDIIAQGRNKVRNDAVELNWIKVMAGDTIKWICNKNVEKRLEGVSFHHECLKAQEEHNKRVASGCNANPYIL